MSTGNLRYGNAVCKMITEAGRDGLHVTLVTAAPVTIPSGGTFIIEREAIVVSRPSDEELGRMVRDAWVRYWTGRPGAKESYLWGWDDPRLPPEQREVDIAIGRALFEFGAITAVKIRHEVDETLL
jgi:hypothetical protein